MLEGGKPLDCTRGGCASRDALEVNPPVTTAQEPRFRTAETVLGDNALVVWGAKPGADGGVFMKLAPSSEIGNAPARLILDDAVDGGQVEVAGLARDLQLFGGTSEALLIVLLADRRELALRNAADGSVRPRQSAGPSHERNDVAVSQGIAERRASPRDCLGSETPSPTGWR